MVMSKDRRGMAVLVDALLFLTVLSMLSAFLLVPSGMAEPEVRDDMVRSFHSVMLAGEVPGGDGSALSCLSLASFLAVVAQDHAVTSAELSRIGSAVNGTLAELENMNQKAFWVLSIDGKEHVFGGQSNETNASRYADRRPLSDDSSLFCTLMIAA
jgi:hypothetical protein